MTNSQYYSDLYSTTHITVSIIEQDFGRQINFMYDPPPLLWVFHNRTSEDLEQELNIAMQEFISVAYKKDTGIFIKAKMEQILNHWIYAGWLTLDTQNKRTCENTIMSDNIKPCPHCNISPCPHCDGNGWQTDEGFICDFCDNACCCGINRLKCCVHQEWKDNL